MRRCSRACRCCLSRGSFIAPEGPHSVLEDLLGPCLSRRGTVVGQICVVSRRSGQGQIRIALTSLVGMTQYGFSPVCCMINIGVFISTNLWFCRLWLPVGDPFPKYLG